MSTDIDRKLAEVLGKLLLGLVFSFIVKPLAFIYGINLLLSSIDMATLPYTLSVYFGVILIMLAVNLRVEARE